MSRGLIITLALAVTFAVVGERPSFAGPIFSDNFNSSLSTRTLNANVPGWQALEGTVDYIKSGGFGIACRGGSGGCIDLDGSSDNAGDFLTADLFTLLAGNTYTLTYWFSGNQRGGSADSMTVFFGGLTNTHSNIDPYAPFAQGTIVYQPLADTTSRIIFFHAGGDNLGLILDDVLLSGPAPTGVPDPGLTLLLLGMGLAGLRALRKRLQ